MWTFSLAFRISQIPIVLSAEAVAIKYSEPGLKARAFRASLCPPFTTNADRLLSAWRVSSIWSVKSSETVPMKCLATGWYWTSLTTWWWCEKVRAGLTCLPLMDLRSLDRSISARPTQHVRSSTYQRRTVVSSLPETSQPSSCGLQLRPKPSFWWPISSTSGFAVPVGTELCFVLL